ncbi:MAG TPA: hypothetical protein VIB07_05075 [Nitrososphaera sp.]|jgi:hypothetical protein
MGALQFRDTWLEIRACSGSAVADSKAMISEVESVPALSEVLSAAEKANADMKHSGMWDYSRRLYANEIDQVKQAVNFSNRVEDARSVSDSANIVYRNSCYTLTLFSMKIQSQ